ncbi:hypothetical protein [Streptomyces sp. NPDC048825]
MTLLGADSAQLKFQESLQHPSSADALLCPPTRLHIHRGPLRP